MNWRRVRDWRGRQPSGGPALAGLAQFVRDRLALCTDAATYWRAIRVGSG